MARICMVAYTHYERDPRVRRDAEALVEAGHSVDIIGLREDNQAPDEVIGSLKIYRIPLSRRRGDKLSYVFAYLTFFIFASCYVSFLHLRNHYGLIHIHNMPNFLVFSALLPKIMGIPIVLDIHDPMPELFDSIFTGKMNSVVRYMLLAEEKISFWFADQLITVHQGMFDLLCQRSVSPSCLEVVHNLPDQTIFRTTTLIHKKQETFTIVYAGTVSERRRLDLALLAVSKLRNEMPDLRLTIIGDGPAIPGLKTLSKEYNVEKQIEFIGAVPITDIPELVSQCNVAIASISDDVFGNIGFSTKAVEALIMGMPVLCTRVAIMLHYFDESTMFYFSPDSVDSLIGQIRLIRNHPELVDAKRACSQKVLEHFNWNQEKVKYLRIIEKLCRGNLVRDGQSGLSKAA